MQINSWITNPQNLTIKKADIHIWRIHLLENKPHIDQLKILLSIDELERTQKFYLDKDRVCYITARGALKHLISLYTSTLPQKIIFNYNEFGKPFLPQKINPLSLQFNISHSNNIILIAFSLEEKIGVDIEEIKPMEDMDSIAEMVFSKIEYNLWKETPEENKAHFFFQLWAYKEAIIKALGLGFSYNTQNFTIKNLKTPAEIIFHNKENFIIPDLWSIAPLKTEEGYCAAYASPQIVKNVDCFEWVIPLSL